jgi:protein N-terminal methyltransferase
VDGVLGGFASLDAPDVRASRRFLTQARDAAGQSGAFAAADVAAGIGRVTKHVLLPCGAASVDVLEPARTLRDAACAFVDAPASVEGIKVGGDAAKCRFLAAPMQDWAPPSQKYDVIWAQWCVAVWNQSYGASTMSVPHRSTGSHRCVGHLTDAHFLRFLQRCRTALKPRGVLVLKDNCGESSSTDDCFEVDDGDRSICRGRAYLEALLALSGAELICTALQPIAGEEAFPADIYPVRSYALRWVDCVT